MGTKEISIEDILRDVDAQIAGTLPKYEKWQEEFISQLDVLRQVVALAYICPPDDVTISSFSEVGKTMIYDVTYHEVIFRIECLNYNGQFGIELKVIKPNEEDSWKTRRLFAKISDMQKNIKELFAQWLLDNMSYLRQIRSKKD